LVVGVVALEEPVAFPLFQPFLPLVVVGVVGVVNREMPEDLVVVEVQL
jgi:hypothetical protein